MAHDSRRKHHRSSSSDNVDKSSKRHKHRHHSHRHDSKRRDEQTENDVETSVPSPFPISNPAHDDVEEGEILEDNGDAEPGEIEVSGDRDQDSRSDNKNLGLVAKSSKTRSEDIDNVKFISHEDDGYPNHSSDGHQDRKDGRARSDGAGNEYLDRKFSKGDKRKNGELVCFKGDEQLKDDYGDEPLEANGRIINNHWNSSSESGGEKYRMIVNSPHDRYRSQSSGHNRERSRSRSIVDEHAHSKRMHSEEQGTHDYTNKHKSDYDYVDEERTKPYRKEHRHHSIDLVVDDRREHSSRYHSREAHDRDISQDRDLPRENKRGETNRNREVELVRRMEKERGRSKERDSRDVEKVKIRDREEVRDRRREKEGDRSLEAVYERDRRRGKERDRSTDRARGGERERYWESERGDINCERYYIKEGDRRDDRFRYKGRDNANGKDKDLHHDDWHNNQDRYRKYSRHEETEYPRERKRIFDPVKDFKSMGSTTEEDESKLEIGEIEQDDIDEDTLQPEQEEDDINWIKEESRRRREAIMEKYKKQHQQFEQVVENEGKDTKPMDIPEALDVKNDGADDSETPFAVGKSPENLKDTSENISGARGLGEGTPKSERSADKFCDDIFGETPTGVRKSGRADGLLIESVGLHDNWDDAEGYYSYRFGEILDGRYEVTAAHGKGVFSTVVRAKNLKTGNGEPEEVAIKIIRNNDIMYKAGMDELIVLKKLVGADPDDKRHCVRFLSSFKYRNHLCLVFESLNMNLREVLKKFGRNIGLRLSAVRAYAKQLFIALKHLRNCGVLHCDIKPDNMLVNEAKNVLKLCDFGNAMFAGRNEVTPYLVSRFYRAPEIILGLLYDHPLDIWSVGCCLYELYTGKVLFPGLTNNDMLRLHMELKGPFPKKMLRKGAFTEQHFDQDLNFLATEEDHVTQKIIKRMILNIKPKDIGTIITGSPGEDPKLLSNFKDLLEKTFVLDPDKRLTVSQALNHPFITGK
ncbi:hypothetical protein Lal_00000460 [Lupinus albus]|uniref:Serine/threonine-protein kinase PRP4 homolog n=1 Tax=Lupinus albus TaxID=3870 RepID=A0A6A4NPW7_LUPAL|nr:putative protein kinase CMGC-DYRK-PRP4 family [Lupinus albus]KAF1861043.1 hypothetical protein Lal_00000460 [Lupinus albus]